MQRMGLGDAAQRVPRYRLLSLPRLLASGAHPDGEGGNTIFGNRRVTAAGHGSQGAQKAGFC